MSRCRRHERRHSANSILDPVQLSDCHSDVLVSWMDLLSWRLLGGEDSSTLASQLALSANERHTFPVTHVAGLTVKPAVVAG